MTTYINRQPIYAHSSPSAGTKSYAAGLSSTCHNADRLEEWAFGNLDKYLSTEPGTTKALKAARNLKRN